MFRIALVCIFTSIVSAAPTTQPLTVTTPGSYEGGVYTFPVIKTTGLVWINRATFTTGMSSSESSTKLNVKFTNCTFSGKPDTYAIMSWVNQSFVFEHNSMTTTGIVLGSSGGSPATVGIRFNFVQDVSGVTSPTTCAKISAFQLDDIHSGGIEINGNQCINTPTGSAVEDVISFARSGGLVTSRAEIHDNFVRGQYAYPRNHSSSGSGIMCFDPSTSFNLTLSGYTDCLNNYVCDVENAGIDAAGAGFITMSGNVVVNCGVGPRTWNWESKTLPSAYGPFVVTNNQSNTFSLAPGVTTSSNNVKTTLTSDELQAMWEAKVKANGWTIGPVPIAGTISGLSYFSASLGVQPVPLSKENLGSPTAAGYTVAGSVVQYPEVDFGVKGVKSITTIAGAIASCTIIVHADTANGPVIATVPITSSGGWYKYANFNAPVSASILGNHGIVLTFTGSANVNSLTFNH